MSHNQHQTHQPKGVAKKTCCEPCNVESLPRVSVKSPAIHPGFKIHHHQSQRRRPNVAGMPFRTPSVFLFLKIKSWDQTSWKKGWSTLIVFLFYIPHLKNSKKNMPTKMVLPYSCFLGLGFHNLDLQDDEDQPKKNDGMFPHLGTGRSQRWKKAWEITTHDPRKNMHKSSREDGKMIRIADNLEFFFGGRDQNYCCCWELSGELRGWRSIGKDATLATQIGKGCTNM